MPIVLSGNSITVTALDVIKAAMLEIGVLAAGENPSNEESSWVLQKLQRLIDRYNARLPMIWNVNFTQFTPPANKQPITIGPGGAADLNVTLRPPEIMSASLILPGNPAVEIPINIRDDKWWADNRIKGLTSVYPTSLYYSPDSPLGNIYLWPIPTAVNNIRLQMRTVIAQLANYAATFAMPPGYWDAIVYPLAVSLCPSFERTATPELVQLSREAIKAIQSNNMTSPRSKNDVPTVSSSQGHTDFNFLTGSSR